MLLEHESWSSLYDHIDQGVDYLYWLLDQPLDIGCDPSSFYSRSVQYIPEVAEWLKSYCCSWGSWLSSPESWNDHSLELVKADPHFGVSLHEYEDPSNWHSFNDFFSRKLASPSMRPVSALGDITSVVSPVDGCCQGQWHIGSDGLIEGLSVKSRRFGNIDDLVGGDA